MILFEKDWLDPDNRGPEGLGPICDTETTNKSFLDYASLLYQMGIKNWAFCLALHDPKLKGVDPFDENLSSEMKIRVGIELSSNPWYYLREVAKVPPAAGSEPVQFKAHRANVGMFWLFMNNVSFFLLQPRQTGKSVVADMINNYLLHYRMFNSKTILVTLTQQLLSENIERIKMMRDLLPQYTIAKTDRDTKAKELYTYPARGNRLLTKVSQSSESGANNIGRGCTTPVQQYDEGAMISYMDVVYPAATAATGAARELAKQRGEPYGTIITTTAGDKTTRSGAYMYNMYQNTADWTEHYYDLNDNAELHAVVKKNSKGGTVMVGATFNHLQLGFTDNWLRERIAETQTTDIDKINRDFFNIWTASGALSPLETDVAADILASERNPEYLQLTKNGYLVKWYIKKEEIYRYMNENHCVIGADTSEAVGRDATSFVVVNTNTLETVCTFSVNEADVIKLADFLVDFMVSFPKTTLIIEHKSTAGTFIETLYTKLPLHGMDPFRRIYNTIIQERDKYPDQFRELNNLKKHQPIFYTQNKKRFGFNQTGDTRHFLFKEVLQVSSKRCRHIIYDKTLSDEMRSLEVDERTGRVDHTAKNHDDNVMAWLLAMWFLTYGKNLAYYGIDSRRVMNRVSDNGDKLDDSKVLEAKLIDSYQLELEQLARKLYDNLDSIYRPTIEHKIKRLNGKLANLGIEPKNIDSMLRDIKERKQEQNRLQHLTS